MSALGIGSVNLQMVLPAGKFRNCTLNDVLYVPDLAFNLLSVVKITNAGKKVVFSESSCEIFNNDDSLIAIGVKILSCII